MIDISTFAIGAGIGAVSSGIFFTGLAWSVRAACCASKPGALLLGSAALRITLLLLTGWAVAQLGSWSALGFAVAFFVVRTVAIMIARSSHPAGSRQEVHE